MAERLETDLTKNLLLNQAGIENIDGAVFDYVNNLNIFCNTINGWNKIPIIWSSSERSFQIKDNKDLRDKDGSLIPPIISIDRTSITKDPQKKGSYQSNLSPGRDRVYITKILNQDKTSNFANADSQRTNGQINFITSKQNKKLVYQHISVPIPIYITVEYKINLITNYVTQMNEAVQPFMARTAQSYFVITKEKFRYECFMDPNFQQDSLNLGEEERKYKTTITIKVLGYLIGEGENQEKPQNLIIENPVELKFSKESIILEKENGQISELSTQNIRSREELTKAYKKVFLVGNGIDSFYEIQHNLSSRDMYVAVRSASDYELVYPGIRFDNLNKLSIDFGSVIGINSYSVTIIS